MSGHHGEHQEERRYKMNYDREVDSQRRGPSGPGDDEDIGRKNRDAQKPESQLSLGREGQTRDAVGLRRHDSRTTKVGELFGWEFLVGSGRTFEKT